MANWFVYDGRRDPNLPGSYQRALSFPNCATGCSICAIYLNDHSTYPSSILAVQDYIANALVTLIPQPNGVGVKHFVYLKNCT